MPERALTRFCIVFAILLAGSACAAVTPTVGKGDTRASTASPTLAVGAKGGSPSPISGVVDPSVNCVAKPSGAPMVMVGEAIYEVADPTHPRLLCQVKNTTVHLFTADTFEYIRRSGDSGTEVVLHSMSSGNESVVAGWPIRVWNAFGNAGTWTPDGNSAATFVQSTGANALTLQVWLFAQSKTTMIWEFPIGVAQDICPFGLTPATLAFSADGQYLVAGWPVGQGALPLRVFRVADGALVQGFDITDTGALWSRSGHRLYLNARSWTPEDGFAPLSDATYWPHMAGLSPDGAEVAYTDHGVGAATTSRLATQYLRVYVYDIAGKNTLQLTTQDRAEVTFVKDGWVWYWDKIPFTTCPDPTALGQRVFAMQVGTGIEQPVVFATGESPTELQSGWSPGQFWPNS